MGKSFIIYVSTATWASLSRSNSLSQPIQPQRIMARSQSQKRAALDILTPRSTDYDPERSFLRPTPPLGAKNLRGEGYEITRL